MYSWKPRHNAGFLTNADNSPEIEQAFAYGKGRCYGRWIDYISGSARSNGHDQGDLIEEPGGIIESILRDEIFTERDLTITSSTAVNNFACDELRSSVDGYYIYAEFFNVTTGHKSWCNGYTGLTHSFSIQDSDASMSAGDNIFITNIQGDNKINYQSFDIVGNTTDGNRKDWKCARSIYNEIYAKDLIDSLLYESRLILFTSDNQYKIKSISDIDSSVDTWTTPLIDQRNSNYMASFGLTHITQLYNDYKINYHFDYGSQQYKRSLFVNKSNCSSGLTNGSTYKTICKSLYDTYGIQNKYEYNCDWINDDATAELFFNAIVDRYSKQRLFGTWATNVSEFIQYEVGDQIILNNSKLIPAGINNVETFVIYEDPAAIFPASPYINFKLLQIS